MKTTITIFDDINLTFDEARKLTGKLLSMVHSSIVEDQKGHIENGVLSRWGRAACLILSRIENETGIKYSPEVESAIGYTSYIATSINDCLTIIEKLVPSSTVTIFGHTLDKKTSEAIFENLTDDFEDMLDMSSEGEIDMSESSSHCLLMKAFMDAGVGKLQTATELLVRLLAESGDEDEARIILKFSM